MTDVCTCRTIAPSGWDTVQQVVDPSCPLHATYTAAEVKVLTETASKVAYALGRKDAGEEIELAINQTRIANRWNVVALAAAGECAQIARDLTSKPSDGVSDAISGVPRHSEVSEAPKAPRECPGCGQNGTGLEIHNSDCPQNPYYEEPK